MRASGSCCQAESICYGLRQPAREGGEKELSGGHGKPLLWKDNRRSYMLRGQDFTICVLNFAVLSADCSVWKVFIGGESGLSMYDFVRTCLDIRFSCLYV